MTFDRSDIPRGDILPAHGPLGVLLPGLGAVATTFVAGVEAIRQGRALPIGSLTQMAAFPHRQEPPDSSPPLIRDVLPLANLSDLVFCAWDPFPDDALTAARKAAVLDARDIDAVSGLLASIEPLPAVFDSTFVNRIGGKNVKKGSSKRDLAEQLRQDIRDFRSRNSVERTVMVWCGSTERYLAGSTDHETLDLFERAMERDDPSIPPSMLYAWAALMEGVPFCNGAPNLTVDAPCMIQLAEEREVPISGKDFKTGQTWLKTVVAPAIRARMLGLRGWYSTNIIGNRDAEVLDDPAAFRTKEESKLNVLDSILEPERYPALYGDYSHLVRINYYPPRGDNKEGWDNIDIVGWLGYPMQIKVNFLCRDSILAAPMVLDLVLLSDLAQRAGLRGIQNWLSFYYKCPMTPSGIRPEHDLFRQQEMLAAGMRRIAGEEHITHPEIEYFQR